MPSTTPQSPSDFALLRAVAERRDRAAFAGIYERYQHMAMGLLMHILRDRDRAEDALQEAFLRIWNSSHTLRDEGNVRGWILRIVAREGARGLTADRRRHTVSSADLDGQAAPGTNEAESVQNREVLEALGRQLEKLEPAQRTVLALHFGGGLSQREIGEVLNLTQQGVGHRLNEALETLRVRLTQAGFAATLPLLDGGVLGQVLTQGSVPSAKVLDGLLANLDAPARQSARGAAAGGWTGAGAAAAAILLAAAGAVWLGSKGNEATPSAPDAESQAQLPANAAKVHRRWTFENGLPEGVGVFSGDWTTYELKPGGAKAVASKPGQRLMLRLLVPERVVPYVLEAEVQFVRGATEPQVGFGQFDGKFNQPYRLWKQSGVQFEATYSKPQRLRACFDGRYTISEVGGNLLSVSELIVEPQQAVLVVRISETALLSVEYRELSADEIPSAFGAPKELITKMENKGIKPADFEGEPVPDK